MTSRTGTKSKAYKGEKMFKNACRIKIEKKQHCLESFEITAKISELRKPNYIWGCLKTL